MLPIISLEDLEDALYWVSVSGYENSAYLSRTTGKIFSYSSDGSIDPDAPDKIEEGDEYIAIPDKNKLDLGRDLVHGFIAEHAPHLEHEVSRLFRKRGAYSRYKSLLQRDNLLEHWHAYERSATLQALAQWAEERGFKLEPLNNT